MPKRVVRPRRKDANQAEITAALIKIGCDVADTHALGDGFGDIVVGVRGKNLIFEIKDGAKSPSRRKLTPAESKFSRTWRGQWAVISSVDEAILYVTKYSA